MGFEKRCSSPLEELANILSIRGSIDQGSPGGLHLFSKLYSSKWYKRYTPFSSREEAARYTSENPKMSLVLAVVFPSIENLLINQD